MKTDSAVTSSLDSLRSREHLPDSPVAYSGDLKACVFALFFAFGGITSLNDVLIPKLKLLFTLSYRDVMLVQSAFFAAYFIVSLPAAALVRRVGYMRSAVVGLLTMMAGCLLFEPASTHGVFALFLIALFVLASGITIVQVVANPLISMLGAPATASSRLTFAQAFNSLGTTLFPYVGSALILGSLATVDPKTLSGVALDVFRVTETQVVVRHVSCARRRARSACARGLGAPQGIGGAAGGTGFAAALIRSAERARASLSVRCAFSYT